MTSLARPQPAPALPGQGARTLSRATLAALGVGVATLAVPLVLAGRAHAPGDALPQLFAVVGAGLLLVPALFSFAKRREGRADAPAWFVAHGVASMLGLAFALGHVAGGAPWAAPPGLLLLLAIVLVGQGAWMRATLPLRLSERFAARTTSFSAVAPTDRAALRDLLDAKRSLLLRLDAGANEATFSPRLVHWLRSPRLTARYATLARREALLVGRRDATARRLARWRRWHLAGAALFTVGLAVHVVVALFW